MGILSWIFFGLIAGGLAKYLMPGRDPGGFWITAIIGIAGAIIGGVLATEFGLGAVSGFDVRSLLVAIIGSLILLFGYQVIKQTT
jgi:uncharacterized membrane protein YeaQ/YmgE (transglycosylase-associated protein family)